MHPERAFTDTRVKDTEKSRICLVAGTSQIFRCLFSFFFRLGGEKQAEEDTYVGTGVSAYLQDAPCNLSEIK